jgi:hypothetical protein
MESKELLNVVFKCVEEIGLEDTLLAIEKGKKIIVNEKHINSIDYKVANILQKISEVTTIPIQTIIYGSEKTDERKIAVSLSVYFIKEFCDLSLRELKLVLRKDPSSLSRYFRFAMKIIKKNNHKTDLEKKFMNLYNQMQVQLQLLNNSIKE